MNESENLNDTKDSTLIEIVKEFISESRCFLCFLNKKYLNDKICHSEIKFASANKLPIFLLKLEDVDLKRNPELTDVSVLATLNFYNLDTQDMLTCTSFNLLINSIEQLFKIKSQLLSDSEKSIVVLKDRPMSPLPPHPQPSWNEDRDTKKKLVYDVGTHLSTNGKFVQLENGDLYNGKFLHDTFFGYGIYKWSNGDVYEGDW